MPRALRISLLLTGLLYLTFPLFSQVTTTTSFGFTGAQQTWVVPAGVYTIDVDAQGAQGGTGGPLTPGGNGVGGAGGRVQATLNVTPGDVLNIYIGGQGQNFVLSTLTGGFNGGGGTNATSDDNRRPGAGGGATDIRIGGNTLADRVLVAGGGGGSGGWQTTAGGAGGGLTGQAGQAIWNAAWGGSGGTQAAGGAAGGGAVAGALGLGGRGNGGSHGGGGGGGGYYGGGGGQVDAGGGGSSYTDPTISSGVTHTQGFQTGNGDLSITYTGYCTSSFTTGCSVGDQIENFSTSGGASNISNLLSGCSPGFNGNYTNLVHADDYGEVVNFTVQSNAAFDQGFTIWVDWDEDLVFEAHEEVWNSGTSSTAPFNGSFTIPFATSVGPKTMRVRSNYNALPVGPCANQNWGETEDYTLEVTSPFCIPNLTTNCTVGDQIENFSTSGGTTNISNPASGCSGNLGDFTDLVHTGIELSTVNFTVQSGPAFQQGFAIYVDSDKSGTFDAGEEVWNSGSASTAAFNGSFQIPCAGDTGKTIMRVVATYASVPTGPCPSGSFGEAEDYTLRVLPETSPPAAFAFDNVPSNLDSNGVAVVTTIDVDSASVDSCSLELSIAHSMIPGFEDQVEFLGSYNGHSYFLSNAIMVKSAAQTLATNLGGYVATINDANENAWIQSRITGTFPFIGLTDVAVEGTFVWDNGDPVSYLNWSGGEPNNTFNEDCAQIYSTTGLWNDVPCGNAYEALIEVEDTMSFSDELNFYCADTSTSSTIYLKAADNRGNEDFDYSQVDVFDVLGPGISTTDFTVYLDSNGVAVIPDSLLDGSAVAGNLYFTTTNSNQIWTVNIDSANPSVLHNSAAASVNGPVGIDYASSTDSLYYAGGNVSNVYRASVDGTGTPYALPNTGAAYSTVERHEVVIDEPNGRLFFTAGDDGIFVANLDGSGAPTQLYDAPGNGSAGLAYDQGTTTLYMSQISDNRIESINDDGSGYTVLYDGVDGVSNPRQVIIDPSSQKVYWVNRGTAAIMEGNMDGSGSPVNLYTAQTGIYGIDFHKPSGTLYWTRFGAADEIYRAPVDGSGVPELLYAGSFGGIRGITTAGLVSFGVSVADNCELDTFTLDADTFYCVDLGVNTVNITANDVQGNVSTGTVDVTVADTIAPIVFGSNDTAYLDINGSVTLVPDSLDSASYDNCSVLSFALSDSTFTCADLGSNSIWFYAIDPSGNADSMMVSVEVIDTVSPVVVTQNINAYLDATGNVTITPLQIDNGTYDSCGIDSLSLDTNMFDCSDVGNNLVTLTAVDLNGNSASAQAMVTVMDTVSPVAVTQNLIVFLDTFGSVTITADSVDNGSSDACGLASRYLNDSIFDCGDVAGSTTIIFTAQDVNGNFDTSNVQITVIDNISPVALAHDTTVFLDTNGTFTLTPAMIDDGSSDACGAALTIDTANFTCDNVGSPVTVTLTVQDPSGNTSTTTAIVTVFDLEPPTLLTQNVNVYLDGSGNASITPAMIDAGTWDSCGLDSISIDINSFTCSEVGPNTVEFKAVDISGNTDSVDVIVTVIDSVLPTILTQNLILFLDSAGSAVIDADSVDIGTSDACGLAATYLNDSVFDCSDVGTPFNIVFTALDVNGNSDTANVQVTVVDNIAPTIAIQNTTVYLDSMGMITVDPSAVDIGTWDSCGISSLTLDSTMFDCFYHGDTVTTYFRATDNNGNIDSQLVDLYVLDTVSPAVFTQNITVYLDSFGVTSITPAMVDSSSWDSCGIASYSLDIDSFDCGNVGPNTVTLTLTDNHGNSANNTAIVTVEDSTAPHILTNNITVYLDSFGSVSLTPTMVNNGTWDSCGIASLVLDSTTFSCANVGAPFQVELTATDVNGNVSSDSVTIVVDDTIAPTILTLNATVFLDSSGSVSFNYPLFDTGTWDSCGIDSIWLSDTVLVCADSGLNNIWFYAEDINQNLDSQLVQLTVLDTQPPVVLAQNLTLYLDASGQAIIDADSVDIGSMDNCAISQSWLSDTLFECADTAITQLVYLYAQDISGNVDSALSMIDVFDTLAPIVNTQNLSVYLDSFGFASILPTNLDDNSTDNCVIDSFWLSQDVFTCAEAWDTVIVSLFARDKSGNIASNTAEVYVFDTIAPEPVTQNITVYLDSAGEAFILPDTFDVNTWDSCGVFELSLSDSSFTCGDTGLNVLTFFAEDLYGNISSIFVEATVFDTIGPKTEVQDLIVYLDSSGLATITADSVDIGTWDSCGIASISIDTSSFDCANHGDTLDVLFTAIDFNGNVSTDTSQFIILDTLAPYLFVHPDTFYLDSSGQFIVDASMLNDSTDDNCTLDSIYLSDTLFSCAVVDSTFDIIFSAVDIFGNADSTPVSVTFLDSIHPIITCNDSLIVANDSGDCGALVGFPFPTAWDNCVVDSIYQVDSTGLDSGSFFPVGFTTLTYVAIDQSDNTDTCSFVIEVQDVEGPQLFCQPDTAICDTTFLFSLPNYIDNCPGHQVIQIAGLDSGAFYPVGTTINRFVVTDTYGNSDTCEFSVLRYDFPDAASAGPDQEQCEVFEATMAANNPVVGFGYWTLVSGTGTITDTADHQTQINNIEPGTSLFEWRIENGVCPVERDTVTLKEFLSPTVIEAGEDQVLCDTNGATLSPVLDTIGFGSWLSPNNGSAIADTSAADAVVSNLELGTYTFTWKVENGACPIQFDEIEVRVVPYPEVRILEDSTYIFAPSSTELRASSSLPVSYAWRPERFVTNLADSIVIADPLETELFIVRGTTEFGCAGSDSITVGVNINLELPTAFTPDGDGFNDVWNLKELANYPNCVVKIYNRWGHLIFESQGYEEPWDGRFNGEDLPSGSYFFVIELGPGEIEPLTGSITIIK